MKSIAKVLHIFGLEQYLLIVQTKKHRRLYFAMPIENFMAWMVVLIMEVARINQITPLALATEIKKYVKDETRKEEQDAEPTQADLSDSIVDHRDSDISKH